MTNLVQDIALKVHLYESAPSITFTNALIFIFFHHKTKSSQLIAEKNKYLTLLNQEKNEFLGIAAHDLKNPLQAIQGSAELIDMTLSEQVQTCKHQCRQDVSEFTQMITESVERMFDLITNLLDVNAIESGKLKIHIKSENILPVLEKVVNEYSKKAQSKHIHIYFAAQQENCNACVDIAALHQVLDNLVSNAVKYSPHGKKIYIHVSEYNQQVRIEVQDEGVGISQEEQKKLFGKFVRLSPKPTGDEHSTGLGLFIVKKLVEAMQGQIRCESQVGQGTKFIAEFPSASHATC